MAGKQSPNIFEEIVETYVQSKTEGMKVERDKAKAEAAEMVSRLAKARQEVMFLLADLEMSAELERLTNTQVHWPGFSEVFHEIVCSIRRRFVVKS